MKVNPLSNDDDHAQALRRRLVTQLKEQGSIHSPQVEAAFQAVPRHLFVPDAPLERAYSDEAISNKRLGGSVVSSSSQPTIMAIMLEQLGLQPGHRVLEIGTGTGYNAALMAHMVGETGQVVTLDIDDDIVASAKDRLAAAGWSQVQAICADGAYGYPNAAPYDRIILTVAAWDIAPAWREQLKSDGRLVLPLSIRGPQFSIAFEPAGDHFQSISVAPCGFMELRGHFVAPDRTLEFGPTPGLQFRSAESPPVSSHILYEWLTGAHKDIDTGLTVTSLDVWGGIKPWLALHEAGYGTLAAQGEVVEQNIVPALFGFSGEWKSRFTHGVVDEHGLYLLMRPSSQPVPDNLMDLAPFRLFIRQFGSSEGLAPELIARLEAWNDAGRPRGENLHFRAYPIDKEYTLMPGEYRVKKQKTQLILHWP